jgi:hypothetical protein
MSASLSVSAYGCVSEYVFVPVYVICAGVRMSTRLTLCMVVPVFESVPLYVSVHVFVCYLSGV